MSDAGAFIEATRKATEKAMQEAFESLNKTFGSMQNIPDVYVNKKQELPIKDMSGFRKDSWIYKRKKK